MVPNLQLKERLIHTAALAMAGWMSLSGAQKKLSAKLSADFRRLQITSDRKNYILKPVTRIFPGVPEIEHTTMQLARQAKLEVAENGLIRASDGQLAYITKRFDRLADGKKVHQEDFCQFTQRPPPKNIMAQQSYASGLFGDSLTNRELKWSSYFANSCSPGGWAMAIYI